MDFTSCLSFPSSIAPNGNCSSKNCSSYPSCYNNISSKASLLKQQSYVFSKYQSRNFKIQLVPPMEAQLKAEQLERSEAVCESDCLRWPSPNDEIPFWKGEFPSWDLSSDASAGVEQDSDLLHIVHVTAEMAPIAKVGGLGDVVTGLGRACLKRGHKVDIMIPFYECIPKHCINELALIKTYNSYHDGNWVACNAYRGEVSSVPVIFIEPSNNFFKGTNIYGGSYNELDAYLFFSRACLEWMQVTGTQPDIIHVHEWQTGALPLFYWDMYHFLSLLKPRIVLTIHNMEHYGECRGQATYPERLSWSVVEVNSRVRECLQLESHSCILEMEMGHRGSGKSGLSFSLC